jgi:hypothetical protein
MNTQNVNNLFTKCKNLDSQLQWECIKNVKTLESRIGKNDIYPYLNYDWNYTTFIDNNYNSDITGATPDGNFTALFKNPIAMGKLMKGYLLDNNPNSKSKSGVDDSLNCTTEDCKVMNEIRDAYKTQTPPKKNSFFSKKLDGENSSSFYFKIGTCKKDLDQKSCEKKGAKWLSNQCYEDRYAYVNNKPLAGNIPSILNDLRSFSPDNLLKIFNGNGNDYFQLEPCDTEHFTNKYVNLFILNSLVFIMIVYLILLLIIRILI